MTKVFAFRLQGAVAPWLACDMILITSKGIILVESDRIAIRYHYGGSPAMLHVMVPHFVPCVFLCLARVLTGKEPSGTALTVVIFEQHDCPLFGDIIRGQSQCRQLVSFVQMWDHGSSSSL